MANIMESSGSEIKEGSRCRCLSLMRVFETARPKPGRPLTPLHMHMTMYAVPHAGSVRALKFGPWNIPGLMCSGITVGTYREINFTLASLLKSSLRSIGHSINVMVGTRCRASGPGQP